MVAEQVILGPVITMVAQRPTPIDHKEIRETHEGIERIRVEPDDGIARIRVGLEGMKLVLEKMARQELKIVAAAKTQSTFDLKEELECLKVTYPINGHESSTKALLTTIAEHPHFKYYEKVQIFLFTTAIQCPYSPYISLFNNCGSKATGIKGKTMVGDTPIELVNFGLLNLSHDHSKESILKNVSCGCKVLDEMSKRDLDVLPLNSRTIERNKNTKAFEDLFCGVFFIANESDVKAFENMHLGWLFLNNENDIDTRSLDSDWKEVLSWRARFDFIVSKIMSSCDLWLDFENDKKTWAKIWPWEESDKSIVLLTEERAEVWVENMKVIQLRLRIFDHEVYFVDYCIAAQLEAINYRGSSPYSTFEDLKENGGNQMSMLFHSLGPFFKNTSLTVEGTASSGQHGRPFSAINIFGQTHQYCENGFNLGETGEKMLERITTEDLPKSIVESIVDGSLKQNSLSKQKSADHVT